MIKKVIRTVFDFSIYILCVLFCMSSIFVLLSFTPIESMAFSNNIILICVFTLVLLCSFILGHRLNRVLVILRSPVQEWRRLRLKQ